MNLQASSVRLYSLSGISQASIHEGTYGGPVAVQCFLQSNTYCTYLSSKAAPTMPYRNGPRGSFSHHPGSTKLRSVHVGEADDT